jgi:hypothetical protein
MWTVLADSRLPEYFGAEVIPFVLMPQVSKTVPTEMALNSYSVTAEKKVPAEI